MLIKRSFYKRELNAHFTEEKNNTKKLYLRNTCLNYNYLKLKNLFSIKKNMGYKKDSFINKTLKKNRKLKRKLIKNKMYPQIFTLKDLVKTDLILINNKKYNMRILDFLLPSKKWLFEYEPLVNNQRKGYEVFSFLKTIKRTLTLVCLPDPINPEVNSWYKMQLIEKFPSYQIWKGYENFLYFENLLLEVNQPEAIELLQHFKSYISYIKEIQKSKLQNSFEQYITTYRPEI